MTLNYALLHSNFTIASLALAMSMCRLGYPLDLRGDFFDSRHGQEIHPFLKASRSAVVPIQAHNQWVPGVLIRGIKRSRREAGHSPQRSAEVKNGVLPPLL
jgi:hypothetical protein